jgi:phosphatidylglycerol lysyltransferase
MTDPERARQLILRYGWNSTVYQLLNPDIKRWYSPGGDALVGYVEHLGVRVVAGAPVCDYGRLPEVAREFESEARQNHQAACYFAVEPRWLGLVQERSEVALVGAQPVWDAPTWAATVAGHASLRAQCHRARNKGVTVQPESVANLIAGRPGADELRRLRERWAAAHGLPPLGFLTGAELFSRLAAPGGPLTRDRRLYVAHQAGGVVGYLVASPIPRRNGWLFEQVIRDPAAPNGTAELLIDAAARDLAALGAERLTLGLAPLSRRHRPTPASFRDSPPWIRLAFAWAYAHGRRFYDFAGLEAFKEKFWPPRWEPVYLVGDGPRLGPRQLYAVAAAFTGGRPITTLGRGVLRAYGPARWRV